MVREPSHAPLHHADPRQASSDPRARNLLATIASEKRNLEGAKAVIRALEASSKNENVIRQAQNEVRSAQASIQYLEAELEKLSVSGPNTPNRGEGSRPGHLAPGGRSESHLPASPSPSAKGFGNNERPLPPPPPGVEADAARKPEQKNYTQLDLLRYDAPLSGAKITRMLNQLQFKLQVEEQYKTGIEKMAQAYKMEGDKRLKSETDAKKVESEGKIQLLRKAKKRYETLAKFGGGVEDDEDLVPDSQRKEALRKPISGNLVISLRAAQDLNHRPLPRRSSKAYTETTVVVKIEGNERAISAPSRNDKWLEEFNIPVEKANEVEITIYDSVAPGDSAPIGMLWLRVSDLVEAIRRQKVGIEGQGAGWVTAATAATMSGPRSSGTAPDSVTLHSAGTMRGKPDGKASEGISGWWSVEPAGGLQLRLDFVKDTVAGARRPYEALGRQGAVRMRKGEVHEMNGHQFVQRQFYQPIMCALCQEFLLTGEGYQCEDCRYACHKKCYPKVVTKCVSKSVADGEGDEEKINHRIPHRFTPYTNMSANWCCHCGYMLPFGRKNSVKCSECALTCHQTCSHLVPDFCGMTMEMANLLLKNLRDIKTTQTRRPHAHSPSTTSVSTLPSYHSQDKVQTAQPAQPPAQQPSGYDNIRPAGPSGGRPMPQLPPVPVSDSRISLEHPSQDGYARMPPVAQQPQKQQQQQAPPRPLPPTTQSPQAQPAPQQQVATRLPPAQPTQPLATRKRKVGLDDFNFLAVLGKGNFGKVMLAEEKASSSLYAIKVLKKEFIIENDEVESTQSEKRVFLAAAQERHPFLLGLHSCFQTETRVYFVMEYISGGDLMLHIQKKQFTLRQAKYYACEVLLALQYFHTKGIIYRDLKLDNILLTLDGHVKVADYGLCKEEMWYGKTTSTFCGTPEFMAPEILLEQRYGRAVDWWAFGVLTYEMLLGQSPFRGEDEDEIFDAILEDEPLYPITMPRDAVSLLQRLLTRDPERRLGAGPGDAEDIKKHTFFRDVNFDDVYHKRTPPPYFPTIGNATDTSNFDSEFTREQPTLTPVHTQLSEADQKEFAGFSWIAPWAAAQA
ncbi:hypothetical protein L202_00413 [Cryptococcus amylolentus CBS 6039]|uniref:protein kinase C n=1 Tax=Cryptococcus amylolentus CBS 6039 TaxID=1295533 RepID=A0A1E3I7C0_9TREE|nr:hypothetical protein L202_00413 [Cryptococcus amylolentus CBS 6039]ODN84467.1 hypothetical protein L202_00413 [Cryptococcus amylolentus CBS 6039]